MKISLVFVALLIAFASADLDYEEEENVI